MKAERRHELQENSLIRGARSFPQFWKDYGSKISLVVILFLLTLVLVRYWLNSREMTQRTIAEQLTSARGTLERYRQGLAGSDVLDNDPQNLAMLSRMQQFTGMSGLQIERLPPDAGIKIRGNVKDKIEAAVAEALKNSSDPARRADATLLRADLNLHFGLLAQVESTVVPSTQPATKAFEKTSDQYFESAAKDYGELIAQTGKIPSHLVASAQFGMAAVHENRDELDKARELYEAISKDGPDETTKKLAGAGVDRINRLKKNPNPLVGPTSKPSTKPATQPATVPAAGTQPATSQATTQPVITPDSRPAPAPAPVTPTATAPSAATAPTSAPASAPTTRP